MKIYILLIFFILFSKGLYSQVLGQDKEGFSTIIQPSASFNLDLTDKVATLNYYQENFIKEKLDSTKTYLSEEMCRITSATEEEYKDMLKDSWKNQVSIFKKRRFIYGIDLKGSSSDGITQLINNEQLLTSSSISGMIGLTWRKRSYIQGKNLDKYVTQSYNYTEKNSNEEVKLIANIENEINELLKGKIIDKDDKEYLLHFKDIKSKENKIESLNDKISFISEHRDFIDKAKQKSVIKTYEAYMSFLEKKEEIQFEDLQIAKGNTYTIQRNLLYFKAGFLGSSFKYDLANNSTSIGDRFVTKNFQGYRLELGYTRQFQRYNFLGLNTAMNRTSNAEDLTSTTFKFDKTDTSVVPNITTGTEFKALSGPFDTFFKYGLSFDYVRLIPFHDSNASDKEIKDSKLLLSINPYIRHNFYSNSDTLKPNTSLGLGLYSFNKESGSIAGGIFVQADDLFNKNRTEAINFTKQISVGIVFKVAIKSFDPAAK